MIWEAIENVRPTNPIKLLHDAEIEFIITQLIVKEAGARPSLFLSLFLYSFKFIL
jgi:hypothetical protein